MKRIDTGLWTLLGGALLFHLLLAPARGWEKDLYWFGLWLRTAMDSGAAHVAEKVWCDYPPGYIYLLEGVGYLWKIFTRMAVPADGTVAIRFLLKLLPILSDLVGTWVVHRIALPRLGPSRALLLTAAYAFNPAMVFNSAVWGQADSVLCLLLMLSFWALISRRSASAFALLSTAILVKFQAVVLLPVFVLGAYFIEGGKGVRRAYAGAGLAALALLLPFFWAQRVDSVIAQALSAAGRYPFISMNAHNVWWLMGRERSPSISDAMRLGNGLITYHTVGMALFGLATALILFGLWSDLRDGAARGTGADAGTGREERSAPGASLAKASALQVMAFYLFPTEMHERYIIPAISFLALLCIWKSRTWWIYVVASAGVFLSLASTLNATYPDHLGPLGPLFPSDRIDALVLSVLFVGLFLLLLLRARRRRFLIFAPASVAAAAMLLSTAALARTRSPVRLCDWEPVRESQQWGERHRDRTVQSHRLSVGGFIFRHGIGTHATSSLTYDLNSSFRSLETAFGIDDEANGGQKARFLILVDGQVRFDSGDVSTNGFPLFARVDVKEARTLRLEVLDGGDGITADHADWLEPTLFR